MTGQRSFLRGVSSGWVQLLVVALLQFAQVRIARAGFSESEFVLFNVLANLVALFLALELGIRSAFARLLLDAEAQGGEPLDRLWSVARCILAVQSGMMLVLAAICFPFIPDWFDAPREIARTAQWVFATLCGVAAAGYAFGTHTVALIARQQFLLVNVVSVAASAVGFILFYVFLRAGAGLWCAVAAAIPGLIASSWVAPLITRRLRISRPFALALVSRSDLWKMFSLGLDLFWIGLYNLILAHTLLVFAGGLLPATLAASFAVNLKFAQFALQAAQRMPGTAEPILARLVAEKQDARFRAAWQLSAKAALLTTGAGIGMLYLWTGWLVAHWTSRSDIIRGVPLFLLVLVPLRYVVHTLFVHSASIFKAAKFLRGPLFLELCIYAALVAAMTPRFELSGLLLANLLSLIVGSLIPGIRLLARVGGFGFGALFGMLCRVTLPLAFALALLCWWVPQPDELSQSSRLGLTGAWFCFTLMLARLFGFTVADRARIMGAIRWRRSSPAA